MTSKSCCSISTEKHFPTFSLLISCQQRNVEIGKKFSFCIDRLLPFLPYLVKWREIYLNEGMRASLNRKIFDNVQHVGLFDVSGRKLTCAVMDFNLGEKMLQIFASVWWKASLFQQIYRKMQFSRRISLKFKMLSCRNITSGFFWILRVNWI